MLIDVHSRDLFEGRDHFAVGKHDSVQLSDLCTRERAEILKKLFHDFDQAFIHLVTLRGPSFEQRSIYIPRGDLRVPLFDERDTSLLVSLEQDLLVCHDQCEVLHFAPNVGYCF